jgi:hypothetical protein
VAEHNLPLAVMDHLVKAIAKVCSDSKIARGLACGRTKTTAIVTNVLGQHSLDSLWSPLRGNKFSLIVDESTDRSTTPTSIFSRRNVATTIVGTLMCLATRHSYVIGT